MRAKASTMPQPTMRPVCSRVAAAVETLSPVMSVT